MLVKIVGFKCHLDSTYTFDMNSMVLLRGGSGAGKSTILQAIFWAMYGSMRGIYNNKGQVTKCSVTLKINDLIIYRQKKPELLQVTIDNPKTGEKKTYDDAVAQQIIDSSFGPRELWKSCSYISQKERCSLLLGTAAERLTLLNQLSFDQDNPKDYIGTIDEKLKETNTKFLQTQTSFSTELDIFTKQLNAKPVTQVLTIEQYNQLKIDISSMTSELERLYQNVLTHERNVGSYNMVCSQLSQVEAQLNNNINIGFDNIKFNNEYNNNVNIINQTIHNLREQVTLLKHYNNIKSRAEKIQLDINNTTNTLNNIDNQITNLNNNILTSENNLKSAGYDFSKPINVNDQMIWQTSQQENQLRQYQNECTQLGCDYNQDSINILINKYNNELNIANNMTKEIQTYNQLSSQLNQLKNQLNQICQNGIVLSEDKIKELENDNYRLTLEISELKKGLELLQCPECSKPLRYINQKLIPGERDPVDPSVIREKETLYTTNVGLINKIRNGIYYQNQIANIESQLNTIDINALNTYMKNPINTSNHKALITKLNRVQIIPILQYSSDYLKSILNHNSLLNQQQALSNQKSQIYNGLNDLTNQLNNIQIPNNPSYDLNTLNSEITKNEYELNKLHESKRLFDQQNTLRSQLMISINTLKTQKAQLEPLLNYEAKTSYETNKALLETSKIKLSDAEYANGIIAKQKELETKRANVISLNEDLVALQRLKQNAINIECKQLQDTVDTINHALTDILPLFFNEPIEMSLQLYKELKTKKELKPGLNIIIKHGGTEYDNINQISGGEGDRVSLALVLALNHVSNSPVIMLDECVSSLDGELKEACIKAMKSLSGKTIICVDHEGVEGYYDKTITVTH